MSGLYVGNFGAILTLSLLLAGCGGPDGLAARRSRDWDDYRETVRSARQALPRAVQMEELFPAADHFITHYGFASGPVTWNTEVFFGKRYTLTMQVDVEIDYAANKITKVVNEPTFYMRAARHIQVLPDGRSQWKMDAARFRKLGAADWDKLFEARGDWSAIGVDIKTQPVEGFEESVPRIRKNRIPVSLLPSATENPIPGAAPQASAED